MSQPGYHPICVLFQGNDCAFDGTYRLVCRHQIRQQDFKPGDNVEVDMGDDDDDADTDEEEDVTVINEDGGGKRWRDAIALGDEMVMSLLRNMCKNQPTGKSPWGSSSQKAKRKRNKDEVHDEQVAVKHIKTEECTTQEKHNKADSGRHEQLLQSILSTVRSVQVTQDLVTSEIRSIQQSQQQLNSQVAAIHKTLNRLEENRDNVLGCNAANKDSDLEDFPTPVSLFLSQPPTSSSLVPGAGAPSSGVSQPPLSPMASTSSTNSHSQIAVSNPVSQGQPDLSTYPTQESLDSSGLSSLPPLYPIDGTVYSHPTVPYNFRYTDDSESRVFLGYHNSPLTLAKNEMEDILFKTSNPAAFAYRLTGKVFTKEELLHSNTSGKSNKKNGKTFRQLNLKSVNIILMEVETRFPTCRNTREGTRRLFAAINERCRNERKKLIYRSDGRHEPGIMISNPHSLQSPPQNKP